MTDNPFSGPWNRLVEQMIDILKETKIFLKREFDLEISPETIKDKIDETEVQNFRCIKIKENFNYVYDFVKQIFSDRSDLSKRLAGPFWGLKNIAGRLNSWAQTDMTGIIFPELLDVQKGQLRKSEVECENDLDAAIETLETLRM